MTILQSRDRLYQLLPALYRQRNQPQGEALRALLGILEEEMLLVERDIDRQYDNWFIETCDEWTVPYLGDLVGARALRKVSQRVYTANHVAHGRRKGTLPVLESLARDITRWPARAVEYMQLVATSQNPNYE